MLTEHTPMTAPGWAEEAYRRAFTIAYAEGGSNQAAATELSRLCVSREEYERLEEELRKAKQPSWFYHPNYTENCTYSPHEVVDYHYDPEPGKHVFEIECARPLPSIWCTVHCLTDDEREAMGTDERFILTEHATEVEARAALTDQSKEAGDGD